MKVKVGDYRDLMSGLRQALTSLKSAVGPAEREREAKWVRDTLAELKAAECRTAKPFDVDRATGLIREAEEMLGPQTHR